MPIWDLTRLIAPDWCLTCEAAEQGPVCEPCMNLLEVLVERGCRFCHNPEVDETALSCPWCERLRFVPETVCSLLAYRDTGRDLFVHAKFKGYWNLLPMLLEHLRAEILETLPFLDFDGLVPIPETLRARFKRSYNPSALLVDRLSRLTGLPRFHLLRNASGNRKQIGLALNERRSGYRQRFQVRSGRSLPRSVILVDDVLTTGATLEAASYALKRAGVQSIAWFTLFRTLEKGHR